MAKYKECESYNDECPCCNCDRCDGCIGGEWESEGYAVDTDYLCEEARAHCENIHGKGGENDARNSEDSRNTEKLFHGEKNGICTGSSMHSE